MYYLRQQNIIFCKCKNEVRIILETRFLFFCFFICRKVSAEVDAFVWDRAGFQALSYKRCVSVLWTNNIYISPIFANLFTNEYRRFHPFFKMRIFVSEASLIPYIHSFFSNKSTCSILIRVIIIIFTERIQLKLIHLFGLKLIFLCIDII